MFLKVEDNFINPDNVCAIGPANAKVAPGKSTVVVLVDGTVLGFNSTPVEVTAMLTTNIRG